MAWVKGEEYERQKRCPNLTLGSPSPAKVAWSAESSFLGKSKWSTDVERFEDSRMVGYLAISNKKKRRQ